MEKQNILMDYPPDFDNFNIRLGKFGEISDLLNKYHYKGNHIGGGISQIIILTSNNKVYGGCIIGKMRHESKYEKESVELRRMVLDPSCPKNTASFFMAKIIKWLKNNTKVDTVYSFADTSVGHQGTIYKAANFKFVKETPASIHVYWNGKRYHPRSLTVDRPYSYALREAVKTGKAEIKKEKPKILYRYEIKRYIPKKGKKSVGVNQ